MSMSTDDFDTFFDSLEDELLPDICIVCGAVTPITDVLKQPWCEEHIDRCDFINWGHAHNWPAVKYGPYEIAEGITNWMLTAAFGNEDRLAELFVEAIGLEEVA